MQLSLSRRGGRYRLEYTEGLLCPSLGLDNLDTRGYFTKAGAEGQPVGNAQANAGLAGAPGMRSLLSVQPVPSCEAGSGGDLPISPGPKVAWEDVAEALHRASRRNLVSDCYTRLLSPAPLASRDVPLFDTLNRVADTMRVRWSASGDWLTFRSVDYFCRRVQQVPDREYERWSASRRQHGGLTLADLVEIARLSDERLDALWTAVDAQVRWGLKEWEQVESSRLRPHWRFLAALDPSQRTRAQSPLGLAYAGLRGAQRREFQALALGYRPRVGQVDQADLAHASFRVEYPITEQTRAKDAPASRMAAFTYTYGGRTLPRTRRTIRLNSVSLSQPGRGS